MVSIQSNINLPQLLSSKSLTQLLQVGQTLTINVEKVQPPQAIISLGKQQLMAELPAGANVKPGPTQVVVKQLEPTLVLAFKQTAAQTASPKVNIENQLRVMLPNQTPLAQTSQQFVQLLNTQQLPSSLQSNLQAFMENLLKPMLKNGTTLKKGLENSGLFLESNLKKMGTAQTPEKMQKLQNDLKNQLLQLKQQALNTQSMQQSEQSALKKLAHLSEQAINRITLLQLQSQEDKSALGFEFMQQQLQHLVNNQLEFRRITSPDGETTWEVMAEIKEQESETLIKTRYKAPDQLSCVIWCSDADKQALWQSHLPELQSLLQEQGFSAPTLHISQHKPSISKQSERVALIDVQV